MKTTPYSLLIFVILICLSPALTLAQQLTCPDLVAQAIAAADAACQATGRNQTCYGNVNMTVQPQDGVGAISFSKVGDIVDVSLLQSLKLSPMNVTTGEWGVALMRLQANLPDALPGQNVTFLLFGDVEVTNAVGADQIETFTPMQAFYLRTGAGDAQCAEAPESGVLVQTPQGVGQVTFSINGVNVDMGSTVFFQSDSRTGMTVTTLEGAAYITASERTQVVAPGTWARVGMGQSYTPFRTIAGRLINLPIMTATAAPEEPRSYTNRLTNLTALPLGMLDREIAVAEPMSRLELLEMQALVNDGILCGQGPLPPCDENASDANSLKDIVVPGNPK